MEFAGSTVGCGCIFWKYRLQEYSTKFPFVCKQAVDTFHLNCKQVLYQLQVLLNKICWYEVDAKAICLDMSCSLQPCILVQPGNLQH